ncbi:SPFH and helix-turn-helix domain-containing protein [Comamonas aquatica]|jgi:excisionase family DNA binding protein|uniref:Virion core protein (Lumpy skin disease virus) n=1 Tax=Comamonas aquatica TaxID=225991 RepID=A0AA35D8D3_9BURK|nr:SPFH and helix-turn-helix domain-containing protein [Comamonas aquatica]CAB5690676.1 Putative virion core protein (lumpy skin disease virus) [Comamonas aquatica]CAB5694463.1 Putative virion core protein (lumpy skin disease virus) [Comamonas aquatica]CAC9196646.1 Putative virion core protein (lumpy skin disease virus) [Comamonas aquatica]CAC9689788.1 Putative virion core protein (lumpy skin disease virus) [Comamonas aquatica]
MNLFNIIKHQLIEVIEWTDDSRDTLSYRWPDDDKEIKNGAQLIVRESQQVQFVAAGQYADLFGPGKHTLSTENVPVLSTILGWKYGFQSPFKCDVYYINTRLFTGNKWGTSNPVLMRDKDFGVVRIRAFGTYDFRIVQPALFLKEVAGTDQNFRIDEFADTMRSRIVSVFTEALAKAQVPVLDVATRYGDLGQALVQIINPAMVEKYGIEVTSFVLENVSVPPEVEQAIDKRSSMGAIGNLNDYVKYQMGQAMASGGEGAAAATIPATMAMGFGMAQEMMKQMQQPATAAGQAALGAQGAHDAFSPAAAQAAQASQATPVGAAPALQVYTPEQAAQLLGVDVADVLAELEAGHLKGRKIGANWRIAQAALDEFLQG